MPDSTAAGVLFTQEVLSYVVLNVDGMQITGQTKDTNGNVLDSFSLSPAALAAPT